MTIAVLDTSAVIAFYELSGEPRHQVIDAISDVGCVAIPATVIMEFVVGQLLHSHKSATADITPALANLRQAFRLMNCKVEVIDMDQTLAIAAARVRANACLKAKAVKLRSLDAAVFGTAALLRDVRNEPVRVVTSDPTWEKVSGFDVRVIMQ